MKQIAQNYKSGELALLEVPVPAGRPGGVLVRTQFSLISTGTEMMKITESKLSLIGKARARPDQVKKVMQSVAQQGLRATYRKVIDRLDSYTPLGYSLCGEVVEVGAGVEDLTVGQRVACAGNSYALHAECNWVPTNLCVPVPDGVDRRARRVHHGRRHRHAGLPAVRGAAWGDRLRHRARPGRAARWCRSCGRPGSTWSGWTRRPTRCRLAERRRGRLPPPDPAIRDPCSRRVAELTGGAGADHIFLAAGGDTNQPVELAAELAATGPGSSTSARCRLDLPWNEYYDKELDVRFSRSYGPGRYDPTYEEGGVDYPIGYVRWTERRNMACFLDLVAEGRLDLDPLVVAGASRSTTRCRPTSAPERRARAASACCSATRGRRRRAVDASAGRAPVRADPRPARPVPADPAGACGSASIGAGNYATSMLLPHLRERR